MQLRPAVTEVGDRNRRTTLFLAMNLTAAFLLAFSLQVCATGYSQTITFSGDKVPLTRVFKIIKEQTGFSLIYNNKLISETTPVSAHVTNMNLGDFLTMILRNRGLSFVIEAENIVIGKMRADSVQTAAPVVPDAVALPPVTGQITNAAGTPLSGISIIIKGTKTGTTTDGNGEFSLAARPGQTLVVSSIEYETQEIVVGRQTSINLVLVAAVSKLNDFVVVGYGQKSRRLLTESISTVGAKEIQKLPVASADAAIQGKVSGVQISNAGGSPGSPASIRIRGVGTVGNTQPLFVIDGIPVGNNSDDNYTNPLSTLNPSDIDNISVLKDGSSAAIYGMRAANGVVLITTKRGKSGAPKLTLDAYYGIQEFPKKLAVNNTAQFIELAQEAITNKNIQDGVNPGDPGYTVLHPDLIAGTPNSVVGRNIDWQDATINKNAPISNYNLGISGGTDKASYFFSVGNFKQQAITKKWDLERYTLRSNTDFKIGKRFKIGQTLALTYQEVNRGNVGEGEGFLYQNDIGMPPFFKIYDDDHSIPGNRYGFNGNVDVGGLSIGSELGINSISRVKERNYRLLGGIYGDLEILNGLNFRSAASLDLLFGRSTNWSPGFTIAEIGIGKEVSSFMDQRNESYTQVYTNTLTYDKKIGDHSINILAGSEYQKLRGDALGYNGTNFQSISPSFYTVVSNGTGSNGVFANANAYASNEAYASYFGRLSYNFREKYLLTATVRRDGTSRFSEANRWGTFPAFSAAWIVSDESFFKNVRIIQDLKLRGSWGRLGNSNTSNFAYIARVSFVPQYPLNGVPLQAPVRPTLPNASIGWETVQSTDFGLDFTMFNKKLSFLATYYNRNTINFLYPLPISYISGFSSIDVNVGKVQNTGFEFDLGYNTKVFDDVTVGISANLTTVKNKLVSLAPGVQEYSSGNYRTAVGYPIGYFYGYKEKGIYQNEQQAAGALPDEVAGSTYKARPGDVIFEDNNSPLTGDANGKQYSGTPDGKITPADRTMLGKTTPDFFYGLNLSSGYHGFDLSVFFQGVSGVQVYNQLRASLETMDGPGRNQFATTQHRWRGEGTSNTLPRAIAGDPYQNNRFSSRFVENAGFLRLKNLQLGYSLSSKALGKLKAFKNLRIYIGATNLFVITKYTGLDPEVVTFGQISNQLGAMTDEGATPQPKTYQAGMQVGF